MHVGGVAYSGLSGCSTECCGGWPQVRCAAKGRQASGQLLADGAGGQFHKDRIPRRLWRAALCWRQ